MITDFLLKYVKKIIIKLWKIDNVTSLLNAHNCLLINCEINFLLINNADKEIK